MQWVVINLICKMQTEYLWRNMNIRYHLQVLGVDGRITLKTYLKETVANREDVEWINLTQDRDK